MSNTVISVRNLGKKYRLGATLSPDTLRDHIMHATGRLLGRGNGEMRPARDEEFWALKDVSFDVQQGEVLGVIGPNGSGKSTLLKILTRITEPTEGEIRMKGRVGSLLEVGTGFHPELTGRENIYMNGAILGMTRAELKAKFDEIVAFSGVEKFLDTPVKRYSSGMRVRLGFAVAAHLEPEILLVDEVLAVGDLSFQQKCMGKMKEVARGGRTVLFVSHNMGAVQSLCGRAMLLARGHNVFEGDSESVVGEYLNCLNNSDSERLDDVDIQRTGDGRVQFVAARCLDKNHEETTNLVAGKPATFEFEYVNSGNVPYAESVLTIYNDAGTAVSCLKSKLSGNKVKLGRDGGIVRCHIHEVPFPIGSYYVTATLKDGTICDQVPNALSFSVTASVFFPVPETPEVRSCAAMVRHRWEHVADVQS